MVVTDSGIIFWAKVTGQRLQMFLFKGFFLLKRESFTKRWTHISHHIYSFGLVQMIISHHAKLNRRLVKQILDVFNLCILEKVMAPHSSTLAWQIPWMEEPGGLQSIGSLRVGQDWATSLSLFTFMYWRRKWQPTPVFLPGIPGTGEPSGLPSMGSHRVGHDWSDLAAAAAATSLLSQELP